LRARSHCHPICIFHDSRWHTDCRDHGREEKDGEEDDERKADFSNEFVFAEVLAEGDEGSEVRRRGQRANVEA
jgi:hypothetical protein